jgi:site-specific recombinase XerD
MAILNLEDHFNDMELVWPIGYERKYQQHQAHQKIAKRPLDARQEEAVLNLIRFLKIKGRSERTVITYEQLARKFFRYIQKSPTAVTNRDVIRFQTDYLIANNYAASTQRQFATTIRLLFEANDLQRLVIDKVDAPRKEKRLPKTLSRTEIMHLLSCCNNIKHRSMLSLLYSSGLRIGELIDLRLADLDFERRTIHIKRAKGRKDRMVGFGSNMAIMLRNYIEQYRPVEFVFNGKGNLQYSATSVRKTLKAAARKAGINKVVNPHMLRHSYATHMIEDGVNLRYVQELLGHHRPETTQIYTHVASEHLMQLKNPFDSLMEHYQHRLENPNNLTNPPSLSRKSNDK